MAITGKAGITEYTGIGGGASVVFEIPDKYRFENSKDRDKYFSSFPDELVDKLNTLVRVENQPYYMLGQYQAADKNWLDMTIVVQGPKGDKGDKGKDGTGVDIDRSKGLAYSADSDSLLMCNINPETMEFTGLGQLSAKPNNNGGKPVSSTTLDVDNSDPSTTKINLKSQDKVRAKGIWINQNENDDPRINLDAANLDFYVDENGQLHGNLSINSQTLNTSDSRFFNVSELKQSYEQSFFITGFRVNPSITIGTVLNADTYIIFTPTGENKANPSKDTFIQLHQMYDGSSQRMQLELTVVDKGNVQISNMLIYNNGWVGGTKIGQYLYFRFYEIDDTNYDHYSYCAFTNITGTGTNTPIQLLDLIHSSNDSLYVDIKNQAGSSAVSVSSVGQFDVKLKVDGGIIKDQTTGELSSVGGGGSITTKKNEFFINFAAQKERINLRGATIYFIADTPTFGYDLSSRTIPRLQLLDAAGKVSGYFEIQKDTPLNEQEPQDHAVQLVFYDGTVTTSPKTIIYGVTDDEQRQWRNQKFTLNSDKDYWFDPELSLASPVSFFDLSVFEPLEQYRKDSGLEDIATSYFPKRMTRTIQATTIGYLPVGAFLVNDTFSVAQQVYTNVSDSTLKIMFSDGTNIAANSIAEDGTIISSQDCKVTYPDGTYEILGTYDRGENTFTWTNMSWSLKASQTKKVTEVVAADSVGAEGMFSKVAISGVQTTDVIDMNWIIRNGMFMGTMITMTQLGWQLLKGTRIEGVSVIFARYGSRFSQLDPQKPEKIFFKEAYTSKKGSIEYFVNGGKNQVQINLPDGTKEYPMVDGEWKRASYTFPNATPLVITTKENINAKSFGGQDLFEGTHEGFNPLLTLSKIATLQRNLVASTFGD